MSQGYQAALGIDTVQPVAIGFEFEQCAITKVSQIIDTSGIRGSRSHLAARTRRGVDTIAGLIELIPTADELRHLLPWILGGVAVDGQYRLGESLGERFVQVDKVAGVFTYVGCLVNRASFVGKAGQPIRLQLEIVGKTESSSPAGTFPMVAYAGGTPFLFSDTVLNLVGQSREVQEWSIVIDNHLEVSFANSTTATRIIPRDRIHQVVQRVERLGWFEEVRFQSRTIGRCRKIGVGWERPDETVRVGIFLEHVGAQHMTVTHS